ncbi:hypothetical protein pb186bvf_010883 [Paramecium bursaria]
MLGLLKSQYQVELPINTEKLEQRLINEYVHHQFSQKDYIVNNER